MSAVDGDRDIGNPIVYSIVSGPLDILAINADTGIVYTQAPLDRESSRTSNGAYILAIEAAEVGGVDEPRARTEVTVIIEVRKILKILFSKKNSCQSKVF